MGKINVKSVVQEEMAFKEKVYRQRTKTDHNSSS